MLLAILDCVFRKKNGVVENLEELTRRTRAKLYLYIYGSHSTLTFQCNCLLCKECLCGSIEAIDRRAEKWGMEKKEIERHENIAAGI